MFILGGDLIVVYRNIPGGKYRILKSFNLLKKGIIRSNGQRQKPDKFK